MEKHTTYTRQRCERGGDRMRFHNLNGASFKRRYPTLFFLLIAAGVVALLFYLNSGRLPLYPCWLLCLSVVTFFFYGYDKRQSMKEGAWRVPEAALHLLSLAGGFAGAFLGRRYYRHKTQKTAFIIVIILSALLYLGVWGYLRFSACRFW